MFCVFFSGLLRGLHHVAQVYAIFYCRFYENYIDDEEKVEFLYGLIETPE